MLTIRPVTIHGNRRWRVDSNLEGRRVRKVYDTKAEARAQIEALELQRRDSGEAWLTLSPAERNEVMTVWREIQTAGTSLRTIWHHWRECRHVDQAPRFLAWLVLGLFAGVRPNELDRLKWADLDLHAGLLRIDAAASNLLTIKKDAAAVSLEFGNSPQILLKHYRELVTAEQADAFWKLRPRSSQTGPPSCLPIPSSTPAYAA